MSTAPLGSHLSPLFGWHSADDVILNPCCVAGDKLSPPTNMSVNDSATSLPGELEAGPDDVQEQQDDAGLSYAQLRGRYHNCPILQQL